MAENFGEITWVMTEIYQVSSDNVMAENNLQNNEKHFRRQNANSKQEEMFSKCMKILLQ